MPVKSFHDLCKRDVNYEGTDLKEIQVVGNMVPGVGTDSKDHKMCKNLELCKAIRLTGMKLTDLADMVGVSYKTLYRALEGKNLTPINAKSIIDALRQLGVSTEGIEISSREQGRTRKGTDS